MDKAQWKMKTEFGEVFLVASNKGLQTVYFQKRSALPLLEKLEGEATYIQILKAAVQQLEEYFSGRRTEFDLPLDTEGTEFQKRVWGELAKIPYGKTLSYADIAKKLNNDKAVRAVGSANGKNPLSIIVPCHRVIQSGGGLGGYSGGLSVKLKLLELEGIQLRK